MSSTSWSSSRPSSKSSSSSSKVSKISKTSKTKVSAASKASKTGIEKASTTSKVSSKTGIEKVSTASNFSEQSCFASTAKIKGYVTSQSATIVQVKQKLKGIKEYKKSDEHFLEEIAEQITDHDKILENFSHLIEETFLDVVQSDDFIEDKSTEFRSQQEIRAAKEREKGRYDSTAGIPLRIYLSEVDSEKRVALCGLANFLGMDYGNKHVALQVGDVVLEWGAESLVIPKQEIDESHIFNEGISEPSAYRAQVAQKRPQDGARLQTCEEEADCLFEISSNKKQRLTKLAKVISLYNRKYYYNLVTRNCQTFVSDALEALGFEKGRPPFKPQREAQFQELRQGPHGTTPKGFQAHVDIDYYILKLKDELKEMDLEDLEYLHKAYNQHHAGKPCQDQLTCQAEKLLQILHQKRHPPSSS